MSGTFGEFQPGTKEQVAEIWDSDPNPSILIKVTVPDQEPCPLAGA
jgi:hypothetical protein